jgi:hypothetical protein
MQEQIWAIIENSVVTNVIVAEEDFAKAASRDGIAVNLNTHCADGEVWPGIGWQWDGYFFSNPNG